MKEAFEKIKERLEEEELTSADAKAEAIIGMQGASANYYGGELRAFGRAIQIVSEVEAEFAEKVCEYEEHIAPSKEYYYLTACKNRWNGRLHGCRPYCPYCGKKIKVVE